MKYKSILLFVVLVAIIASFNFTSCHKYEGDGYSEWMETTEVDYAIYTEARKAYLDDPANASSPDFKIMQFLSHKPLAVRTKVVENGMNYQFACRDGYAVTVYKGTGDKVGKVIGIEEGYDSFPPPIPPDPRKRDTLIW